MAKACFQCAECDTDITVVGRNRTDADRLAKWHQTEAHICPVCQDKHRAADNAASAAANEAAGLPALSGSDKQVAWAETIRKATLERLDALQSIIAACGPADRAAHATSPEIEHIGNEVHAILAAMDGPMRALCESWIGETLRAVRSAER